MSSSLEDESGSDFEFVDDDVEESSTILDYQDDNQDSFGETPRRDSSDSSSFPRMSLNALKSEQGHQSVGGAPLSRRRRSSKQECFIEKLFKMATCKEHASVFGFSDDGTYIEIRTPSGLAQVLNRYFKHSNSSSFIRQLNNYGFKTMSSISTGKNIQCFIHPQFKRDAPAELEKITRKTARVLKKCKREIIKELQSGEAACRKRVKDLEQMNARLEGEVRRLERENAMLVGEISNRAAAQQPQAPCLASNRSSASVSEESGGMEAHYQRQQQEWTLANSMHSSTTSVRSMSSTPTDNGDYRGPMPRTTYQPFPNSMDGYYLEPVLEMVSDYSDESPLFNAPAPMLFTMPLGNHSTIPAGELVEDRDGFLVSRPASAALKDSLGIRPGRRASPEAREERRHINHAEQSPSKRDRWLPMDEEQEDEDLTSRRGAWSA